MFGEFWYGIVGILFVLAGAYIYAKYWSDKEK